MFTNLTEKPKILTNFELETPKCWQIWLKNQKFGQILSLKHQNVDKFDLKPKKIN